MGVKRSFMVAALLGLLAGAASLSPAQEPPRRAGGFVPGQKRPPGDPAQIARGKTLFDINCRGCHGATTLGLASATGAEATWAAPICCDRRPH